MLSKDQIREKFLKKRKANYFEIDENFFKPLMPLLNKKLKKNRVNLSIYYPTNYEVNISKLINLVKNRQNLNLLLPIINSKNKMSFVKWSFLDVLKVNKYGILEPLNAKKKLIPNILLVPLLAFDNRNYRLGYGKGFYDKYLNKYLKLNKGIITIGIAFSFQKYNKLPVSSYDVKLDYILSERGLKQ